MLSNPTTGLHARQKQHRRQNSTSSAFEGVKIPQLPNANQRQAGGHRRGLSLDNRRQKTTSPTKTRQQDYTVSMSSTNTGSASTSQHPVLREAQQQRITARPGTQQQLQQQQRQQQQLHQRQFASQEATLGEAETYLISPHGTPSTQRFDPSCFDQSSVPFDPYGDQLSMMMQKNQANYGSNMVDTKDFELFANDSTLSTPTFMSFADSPSAQGWVSEGSSAHSRRSSRRISDGIMDRVSKFETLGIDEMQAPMTPPNQNAHNFYPPTPMGTPHQRAAKQQAAQPNRFSADYDESLEETLKPSRNRSNQRAQDIFQEMRQRTEQGSSVPSPPKSSTMPSTRTFEAASMQTQDFLNMNAFKNEFIKMDNGFDNMYESDALQSASDMSQHASPDMRNMDHFAGGVDEQAEERAFHPNLQAFEDQIPRTPSSNASRHRRTESVASVASAASIASINIEETKTETGVTVEEISQFIRGPDTPDGKWTCIFEDCGKMFGRKENIKSHVQTHLNDRQYQCPTCKKCFVRQHDLKRHAKIHTGIKPYPCECGNSFARHDALTRHRQRGMCIGAFDGIVRKVVKRGRPRKNRPDIDTRMEKSARTRKKNMSISSISSQSCYSDSSAAPSPENDFDMIDCIKPMVMETPVNAAVDRMASMSSAPMPTIPARTIHDAALSPSAASVHSYVSPEEIMEKVLSQPPSPAKSSASHFNTPPELSQSSSPPPAAQFFDVEPSASCGSDDLSGGSNAMVNTFDQDDDLLLQFTNDDGLVQLDRDPSMFLMSKFDEEFDNAVGMFTNSDDVFFDTA